MQYWDPGVAPDFTGSQTKGDNHKNHIGEDTNRKVGVETITNLTIEAGEDGNVENTDSGRISPPLRQRLYRNDAS